MKRAAIGVALAVWFPVVGEAQLVPTDLLCEWRPSPAVVSDPCPELTWRAAEQARYRVIVASDRARAERDEGDVWDSGWVGSPVACAEYAGPALEEGRAYFWRVRVASGEGGGEEDGGPYSEIAEFTYERRDLPRRLPHIRTFVNFGSNAEVIASRYDLTFRKDAKQFRPEAIALNYSLLCTMVIPSEKADALAQFCVENGLTQEGILEDMFIHFARDTNITLHVGAERAENPRETRRVPGWDPNNDANGDGRVDDAEVATLRSPDATARDRPQARVPIYYWGPPRDDFVMNVGNPHYQRFCAEVYAPSRLEGFDGIWVDTVPPHIPGPGGGAEIVEYPGGERERWRDDLVRLLCTIKRTLPDRWLLANGWNSTPFVLDGAEYENWLNIATPLPRYLATLDAAADRDRRGKIQMLQVNPAYHPEENEFGVKADVDPDRDRIFALGTYYLIAGDCTYFGFGQHPYRKSEERWFPAIEFDVGRPKGDRYVFAGSSADELPGPNLLVNGDFEDDADGDGNPDGWTIIEPVEIDRENAHSGTACVRIDSTDHQINNISKQYVTLKPYTAYTLSAWIRTEDIANGQGAQVYPYEFEGATGSGISIVVHGTQDWKRMVHVFTTADDAEGRVNFRVYGSTGIAWFDDLRLVEGSHGDWKVLAREFERALVLVKPFAGGTFGEEGATDHDLPALMKRLRADGSLGGAVKQVKLRSGEAAILVR
jgi:hypothetical protein